MWLSALSTDGEAVVEERDARVVPKRTAASEPREGTKGAWVTSEGSNLFRCSSVQKAEQNRKSKRCQPDQSKRPQGGYSNMFLTSFVVFERLLEADEDLFPKSEVGHTTINVRLEKLLGVFKNDGRVRGHDGLESLEKTFHDGEESGSTSDEMGLVGRCDRKRNK